MFCAEEGHGVAVAKVNLEGVANQPVQGHPPAESRCADRRPPPALRPEGIRQRPVDFPVEEEGGLAVELRPHVEETIPDQPFPGHGLDRVRGVGGVGTGPRPGDGQNSCGRGR